MDKKVNCAICFSKDDGESGEDEGDIQYDIFHPTAGATNDRFRAPGDIPDDDYLLTGSTENYPVDNGFNDNDADDVLNPTTHEDHHGAIMYDMRDGSRVYECALPVKSDILYAPLSYYYYTSGTGLSTPESEELARQAGGH